jgi:hypothetical protein
MAFRKRLIEGLVSGMGPGMFADAAEKKEFIEDHLHQRRKNRCLGESDKAAIREDAILRSERQKQVSTSEHYKSTP